MMRFLVLCLVALLMATPFVSDVSAARRHGQRVAIDQLPEDGHKPFLMVFTQTTPTVADQFALSAIRDLGIGDYVRYHHITANRATFKRWFPRHGNATPYIAIVSADGSQTLKQVTAAEMPATSGELLLRLLPNDDAKYGGLLPWRNRIREALERTPDKPAPDKPPAVTKDKLPSAVAPAVVAALNPLGGLDIGALLLSVLGGGAGGALIARKRIS
jgi:hypothetical protein